MPRHRPCPHTLSLLDYEPPRIAEGFSPGRIRAARLESRLALAVGAALKEQDLERAEVARRMTEYLGDAEGAVTPAMLDAYASQARASHTINSARLVALCQAILKEMGIGKPAPAMADMLEQMAEQLLLSRRPLIVDEADYLASKGMIELIRDVYESSDAPIVLIGEEGLPLKLKAWERVHGRMLDWVAAQPVDLKDSQALAKLYARGIAVAEDLLAAILKASAGSVRRVCVNLDRVREAAETADVSAIDLARWQAGSGAFFTGAVPGVRRAA